MNTNQIHPSASIHSNGIMGEYNRIGKNVTIDILNNNAKAVIGDNNIINDNTRIIISGDFSAGDWNVFHNDMLIMADDHVKIGHNCWFGQNTILDGAGGLEIGNGVRVGMYSQIWTHVASGEQIEGCTFFSKRKECSLPFRIMALVSARRTKKASFRNFIGCQPVIFMM